MVTIKLEAAFYTNEYTETPHYTVLNFEEADIARIKHLQEIAEKEDITIRMDFQPEDYQDFDGAPVEWTSDYSCIQIYSSGDLYYYAQNKYDSADQYETEVFSLQTLLKTA